MLILVLPRTMPALAQEAPWFLDAGRCPAEDAVALAQAVRAEAAELRRVPVVELPEGADAPQSGQRFIRLRGDPCFRAALRVTIELGRGGALGRGGQLGRGGEVWLRDEVVLADTESEARARVVALRVVDLLRAHADASVRPDGGVASASEGEGEVENRGAGSGAAEAGGGIERQAVHEEPPARPVDESRPEEETAHEAPSRRASVALFGEALVGFSPTTLLVGPGLEVRHRPTGRRLYYLASPVVLFARTSHELGDVEVWLAKIGLGLGAVFWSASVLELRADARLDLGYGHARGEPRPGAIGGSGGTFLSGLSVSIGALFAWSEAFGVDVAVGAGSALRGIRARADSGTALGYDAAVVTVRLGLVWST